MELEDYTFGETAYTLENWFSEYARDLPWRNTCDPYAIWVSEIMLQQTRVDTVLPYYSRFLKAFPDLQSLAGADENILLKLWEGLGYYSRVRNLQRGVQIVIQNFGGVVPSDPKQLETLPGVGSYTAGAIASQAYGERVCAVDGNVLRVMMRLSGDRSCIDDEQTKKRLREYLNAVYGKTEYSNLTPKRLNQALMELGALICIPNGQPHCSQCPVQQYCRARRENLTGELPVRKRKKARRVEKRTILILQAGNRVALRKRPGKGLLAGLWELPNTEGELDMEEVLPLTRQAEMIPQRIEQLHNAKHIFSHVEWEMSAYKITGEVRSELTGGNTAPFGQGLIWVDRAALQNNYALPSAFSAYRNELVSDGTEHAPEEG